MNESKTEDNQRYFFHIPEVDAIENGNRCYIIGRKGAGKTAVSEYLNSIAQAKTFSHKLTFKNFPFNELYELKDNRYTFPNIYITLWKYVIYSSVARMMSRNQNIDSKIRGKLLALYEKDMSASLGTMISRWTGHNIEFTILGSGVQFGASRTLIRNEMPWIDRVQVLENVIETYADESSYYVIFDELDEDYQNLGDSDSRTRYNALLIGLFKAVQDVKARFSRSKARILPVTFLRDDIYNQLTDSDKTKWLDFTIRLSWDTNKIKELLAFRISRAFSLRRDTRDFETSWNGVSSAKFIPGYTRRAPFDYMEMRTLSRPRDYVYFLKLFADAAVKMGKSKIDAGIIVQSEAEYSSYLKSEFEGEIKSELPDISTIFDLLTRLGKQYFSASEFADHYIGKDPLVVLNTLFEFSVVGNILKSSNRSVFKYREPHAQFGAGSTIQVHRGLWRRLSLV